MTGREIAILAERVDCVVDRLRYCAEIIGNGNSRVPYRPHIEELILVCRKVALDLLDTIEENCGEFAWKVMVAGIKAKSIAIHGIEPRSFVRVAETLNEMADNLETRAEGLRNEIRQLS